jgi:hypothetical protein
MSDEFTIKAVKQDASYKLEFYTSTSYSFFCVNAERAQKAANNVRLALKNLAVKCFDQNADYTSELRRLRIAGKDLGENLFGGAVEENFDCAQYTRLQITKRREERATLRIITDAAIQIPWNFIFDNDPFDGLPISGDISDFDGFWLSNVFVYVRYSSSFSPIDKPLDKQALRTLMAFDENEFDVARGEISKQLPDVDETIANLTRKPVGAVTDWDNCREKWEEIRDCDSVIYIFGHSNGKEISLHGDPSQVREDEKQKYILDTASFAGIFTKNRGSSSKTLCFLNACRSAGGVMSDGFLGVTHARGFHGFIGAEAEISNIDATLYATEFLNKLVNEGRSVGQIVNELRGRRFPNRRFPTGIWYTCYADPEFRVS